VVRPVYGEEVLEPPPPHEESNTMMARTETIPVSRFIRSPPGLSGLSYGRRMDFFPIFSAVLPPFFTLFRGPPA
jgi:hypothetical protein